MRFLNHTTGVSESRTETESMLVRSGADRRPDLGIGEHLEAVPHVARGDGLAVVPARARVEREGDRQRVRRPRPLLGEPRREPLVADRLQFGVDLGEAVEDQILNQPAGRLVDERRKEVVASSAGGDDQRPAGRRRPTTSIVRSTYKRRASASVAISESRDERMMRAGGRGR